MKTVGFVGLGLMGAPMAARLARGGKGGGDLRHLGEALGVPLPATGAICETFTAARSRGHGDLDSSAVYCLLRELSESNSTS